MAGTPVRAGRTLQTFSNTLAASTCNGSGAHGTPSRRFLQCHRATNPRGARLSSRIFPQHSRVRSRENAANILAGSQIINDQPPWRTLTVTCTFCSEGKSSQRALRSSSNLQHCLNNPFLSFALRAFNPRLLVVALPCILQRNC